MNDDQEVPTSDDAVASGCAPCGGGGDAASDTVPVAVFIDSPGPDDDTGPREERVYGKLRSRFWATFVSPVRQRDISWGKYLQASFIRIYANPEIKVDDSGVPAWR